MFSLSYSFYLKPKGWCELSSSNPRTIEFFRFYTSAGCTSNVGDAKVSLATIVTDWPLWDWNEVLSKEIGALLHKRSVTCDLWPCYLSVLVTIKPFAWDLVDWCHCRVLSADNCWNKRGKAEMGQFDSSRLPYKYYELNHSVVQFCIFREFRTKKLTTISREISLMDQCYLNHLTHSW